MIEKQRYIDDLLNTARYREPKRLQKYGFKVYSQNMEDGIIQEIFNRIGIASNSFIEIGVETGFECNTTWLLLQGWNGMWIEGHEPYVNNIKQSFQTWIETDKLKVENRYVNVENINNLIGVVPRELDLLSIDVDSFDYWIWKEINIKPRVVVIEYNSSWRPPVSCVVPYEFPAQCNHNWFGASITALNKLSIEKGYSLVGCDITGTNAFFVRNDLIQNNFFDPGSVDSHYEPSRYYLSHPHSGHGPNIGKTPLVKI